MAQVDSAAMSFPAYNEAIITRTETTEQQENKALTDKYYCIFLLRFQFFTIVRFAESRTFHLS